MQPISILFAFLVGSMLVLTMTYALATNLNQEKDNDIQSNLAELRLKRSLANKRFYDFGSRSLDHMHDENNDDLNDEFNRLRRFYDFGSKKRLATRFYDFGSKKKRSNE